MIATLAFSFTNINLAQAEPLQFVGLKNYEDLLKDQQVWTSLGITLKFAALALPVAVDPAARWSRCCSTRGTCVGSGLFRVLFFLPYVVPFVADGLHLGRHAQPGDGLDQRGRSRRSAWRTRPPGSRIPAGSTRASHSSACGASAPG